MSERRYCEHDITYGTCIICFERMKEELKEARERQMIHLDLREQALIDRNAEKQFHDETKAKLQLAITALEKMASDNFRVRGSSIIIEGHIPEAREALAEIRKGNE